MSSEPVEHHLKIGKMIQVLQEMKDKHGDLEVAIMGDDESIGMFFFDFHFDISIVGVPNEDETAETAVCAMVMEPVAERMREEDAKPPKNHLRVIQ